MYLSLNKAAKEAGISKSTLSEALNSGRLTAAKDDRGRWQIDPAALFQVFEKTRSNEHSEPIPNAEANTDLRIEIAELKASLNAEKRLSESLSDQVTDLRERLDKADARADRKDALLEDLRDKATEAPIGQGGKKDTRGLLGRIINRELV